jgi:hypothetical protein
MTIDNAECLLCHAIYTGAFGEDGTRSWRCSRCGQHWDAARVTTVMNYQRWAKAQAAAIAHGAAA